MKGALPNPAPDTKSVKLARAVSAPEPVRARELVEVSVTGAEREDMTLNGHRARERHGMRAEKEESGRTAIPTWFFSR